LGQRGYRMIGLDLNEDALAIARQRAQEVDVEVTWHAADMRDIPYEGELDAVISIFSSWVLPNG
jgi:ubiquinone/menaquinone biosynthesis C-methylase UbiE